MRIKELLNRWTKLCLRKNKTPICLITVSEDGSPHVFSDHEPEFLAKIYKHLLDSGPKDVITHFDDQEN